MSSAAGFWRRLALFALPLGLPVLLLSGVMLYTGESLPLAWVVAAQQADPATLYRPQYGNRDFPYKRLSAESRQALVLALGSSRVLQMRAGLLTQAPDAFYNAGAPAWQLREVTAFVAQLGYAPDVLLLGIDAPWFNPAYVGDESAGVTLTPPNAFQQVFAVNRSVMQDVLAGRAPDWARLLRRQNPDDGMTALGLKAIQNGHGFRADGSELYGDFLVGRFLHQPTERARHLDWMRAGQEMYVYGSRPSAAALADFSALLDLCAARGITVIGFMPPYAPTLYAEMMANGQHAYLPALSAALADLFAARGLPFLDLSDGGRFGSDDDFFDGWHGSERVYLRVYLALLEAAPEALGWATDAAALRAIDAAAPETWRVF